VTPPRVLMVVGAYYPELAGGSLQCRTLVLALRDRVRIRVLTTTATRDAPEHSEVDGIPVYRIFVDSRDWRSKLVATARLMRLLPRLVHDCDIFHFHGFTEKMLLLFAAAKVSGLRTIEKMTSLGWDDPIAIRSRPLGRLLAAAQTRVDRIVAVTPALRDRCVRAGMAEGAVVTIPNGVDTERFAPVGAAQRTAERTRLGLPLDAPIVTFVGFWSAEKGPNVLFDAWERARLKTGVDAALVFIGPTDAAHAEVDRQLVDDVRRRIDAAGLQSRVVLVERTTDVAAYLQASDVFAVPSSREGLSNALLEAMSAGLPSITGAIAGVSDSVIESGVNGYIVPAGDAGALADILARLLSDDRLRRDVGRRARQSIVERFAMSGVAERYFALYADLIGAASHRG
jgi:glycosyltransferase involved in cell wall biosynthesis